MSKQHETPRLDEYQLLALRCVYCYAGFPHPLHVFHSMLYTFFFLQIDRYPKLHSCFPAFNISMLFINKIIKQIYKTSSTSFSPSYALAVLVVAGAALVLVAATAVELGLLVAVAVPVALPPPPVCLTTLGCPTIWPAALNTILTNAFKGE